MGSRQGSACPSEHALPASVHTVLASQGGRAVDLDRSATDGGPAEVPFEVRANDRTTRSKVERAHRAEGDRQLRSVSRREQGPQSPFARDPAKRRNVRDDRSHAERQGLEQGVTGTFVVTAEDEQIGARIKGRKGASFHTAKKTNARPQRWRLGDPGSNLGQELVVAEDHRQNRIRQGWPRELEPTKNTEGVFVRVEPADPKQRGAARKWALRNRERLPGQICAPLENFVNRLKTPYDPRATPRTRLFACRKEKSVRPPQARAEQGPPRPTSKQRGLRMNPTVILCQDRRSSWQSHAKAPNERGKHERVDVDDGRTEGAYRFDDSSPRKPRGWDRRLIVGNEAVVHHAPT
jgi:hypothetical protein